MTVRQIPSRRQDRDVRRAWWSFALFVPSFVASFLTGEGLVVALGYGSGDQEVPAGIALAAGLPAIIVFALPTLLVWHFGSRAERHGNREGRAPIVVALVLSGGFLALNLVQLVARLLL